MRKILREMRRLPARSFVTPAAETSRLLVFLELARNSQGPAILTRGVHDRHAPLSRVEWKDVRRAQELIDPLFDSEGTLRPSARAARQFNLWWEGREVPLRLVFDATSRPFRSVVLDSIPYLLWRVLTSEDADRVRRCPQCGRYFFDGTRNQSQRRCSPRCTNRFWNRARRRSADHRIMR